MHGGEYNQAETMIEPSASENDQQQDSDELHTSETVDQLTINVSVPTDSKVLEKNDGQKSKDQDKCCTSDAHKGNGKRGQELDFIEANYLNVNIDNIVERVYRYDVKIRMNGPKKLYTKVFSQFCAENLLINQRIAFDDDKMIALSPCELKKVNGRGIRREFKFILPDTENDWKKSKKSQNVRLNKTWLCEVSMRPARKFSIPIKRVLAGKDPQHRYDAIQAMNTILNSAYHQDNLRHGIQDGRSLYLVLNDELPDIKEHYELRSGLHQRIIFDERNGSIRPLLNVDVKHRAFPRQFTSLIDLLHAIQKEQTTPRCIIDLQKPLSTDAQKKLTAHLSNLEICYKIDDMNNGISKFLGLGNKSAYEVISRVNGTVKMLKQYFDDRNLRIKYPFLQCIRLEADRGHISVPLECCSILGDQLVQKKFSERQSEEIKRHTVMDPADRKEMIMHHLQAIGHNKCETIRAFGLKIDENFVRVPARQLEPPTVEYRDRKMIKPKDGEWSMNFGCDEMEVISSPTSFTWTILNTDSNLQKIPVKLKQFAKGLYRKSLPHGIKLNEQPEEIVFAELAEIKEKLKKMHEQGIDIVICIIPSSDSDEYNEIKIAADLEFGILTQCIKSDTITNGTEYRETFLLNINAKLNGINQKLLMAPILKDFDTQPVMFIGAYITTPTTPGQQNAPSVAGMVASHDANAFCYSIGRRSQDETITTFQSNFMENLKLFRQKNNRLPIKLIYFRQDESGSPSRDTIESERKAMLRACREIDEGHDVQITIIIVEQEAHMRLFSLNSNAQVAAKSTNVPPGTVIDTFMTNRHQRTFYMVSQKAVEGVTRPTKYRIFLDEANHCIYDLQELIFFLCHMFARCNRSVSSPAPTHHARLVARHSKVYLTNGNAKADAELDNNNQRPVKNDGMYYL